METNIEISIQTGYIKNKDLFVTPAEANRLPDNKVCYYVLEVKVNH